MAEIRRNHDIVVGRGLGDRFVDFGLHVRRQRFVVHEIDLEQLAHVRGVDEAAFQSCGRARACERLEPDIGFQALADQIFMAVEIAEAGQHVDLLAERRHMICGGEHAAGEQLAILIAGRDHVLLWRLVHRQTRTDIRR